MALYEHVFLARQDLAQAQVDALAEAATKIIQDRQGRVVKTESWGLRSLAYKSAKNRMAHYVLMESDAPGDLHHHVMRLAVLGDAIRKAAQAPALGLDDLALVIRHDLGSGFRQCVHLRLCQILARKEHVLVQSHAVSFVLADR